jgi:hypothetical protein
VTAADKIKLYGDTLTWANPVLNTDYRVTGFVDAALYGGVFAQDACTGAPAFTSAGAAAMASFGGYPITVAQGGLVLPSGYAANYQNGSLTVLPDPAVVLNTNVGPVAISSNTGTVPVKAPSPIYENPFLVNPVISIAGGGDTGTSGFNPTIILGDGTSGTLTLGGDWPTQTITNGGGNTGPSGSNPIIIQGGGTGGTLTFAGGVTVKAGGGATPAKPTTAPVTAAPTTTSQPTSQPVQTAGGGMPPSGIVRQPAPTLLLGGATPVTTQAKPTTAPVTTPTQPAITPVTMALTIPPQPAGQPVQTGGGTPSTAPANPPETPAPAVKDPPVGEWPEGLPTFGNTAVSFNITGYLAKGTNLSSGKGASPGAGYGSQTVGITMQITKKQLDPAEEIALSKKMNTLPGQVSAAYPDWAAYNLHQKVQALATFLSKQSEVLFRSSTANMSGDRFDAQIHTTIVGRSPAPPANKINSMLWLLGIAVDLEKVPMDQQVDLLMDALAKRYPSTDQPAAKEGTPSPAPAPAAPENNSSSRGFSVVPSDVQQPSYLRRMK